MQTIGERAAALAAGAAVAGALAGAVVATLLAAGTAEGADLRREAGVRMAQAAGAALRLEVVTQCAGGAAIFRVRNGGETWPSSGTFNLVRIADNTVISRRSFRLVEGQRASFKVDTAKIGPGPIGLSVEPTWTERGRGYDATIDCGG